MLDDGHAMVGNDARRRALLVNVFDERLRRRRVALVLRGNADDVLFRPRGIQVPPQLADARRDVRRARRVLAVPEGHPRRRARRGRDNHPIVLDSVHAPGRRAELKHVADARLVDELLVQFAKPRPIGEIHGVQAAVGNRAAIHDRHESRAAERR